MQVVVCDGNKEKRTISLESFGKDVISFGRHPESDIVLSSSAVSRVHGCFYLENGLWHVKDLESTNGIFTNGNRVDEKCLSDGIEIVITNNKEVNGTVRITLKEEKNVTKNSNVKKIIGITVLFAAFVGILCVIVGGIISKSDNKKDKSDVVQQCYNDVTELYEEGDYYNAMLQANAVLEDKDMQEVSYYEELQEIYDTCYVEMKTKHLEKMEQLYLEDNAHDYEVCREQMQEIYGSDINIVKEINNNIKLFSMDYMVVSEREISDYGDDTYIYIYNDENGSVTVDKTYIAPNLYRPELFLKMCFYNTDTVQFHNLNNVNIQYDTYIDNTRKVELTFDEEGKVITSYNYDYDSDMETYYEFIYNEEGKCIGYGDDVFKTDISYDDKGNLSKVYMYSATQQEEYMDVCYYYDEQNRVTGYEGTSFGWECSGKFEYDDENMIVYFYDEIYDIEPESTMYYDERGVCYKEVSDFSEIYYEYIEVLNNPDFGTEVELYVEETSVKIEEVTEETEEEIEDTTEETEATTEEMTTEETTEEITTEIDKVALCALNPDILGVNLYDNYNPETEYSEVTMAQVADMVFYDEMSYTEFVSVIEGSAFDCSGYIGDPEIILTPYQGMDLVVSINGEEVFEAGIFNMGDESARFKECTLTHIRIIEGTSWTWYNSYGIGAYGENVPDYFTFIDTLNSYGIRYDEGTADDGNLEVKLIKEKPDDRYYAVCSFVFDRYEGECLYTSWDKGVNLVPEIGTADPY